MLRLPHTALGCIAACMAFAAAAANRPAAALARSAIADRISAGAERFEQLTEQAFDAKPSTLHAWIASASSVAGEIESELPADAAALLKTDVAALHRAEHDGARADVARAAVECYRVLVTAAPPRATPVQVSLLDYAGFRYDADLKARPARWTDMQAAADYATQQWMPIRDRIADRSLRQEFQRELEAMQRAAVGQNATDARRAVTAELDAVDRLESYFSK